VTYIKAALAVLRRARRPLTTREVTDGAIVQGLIRPQGKTPIASMGAQLYRALAKGTPGLEKLEESGPHRARKGSVRWQINR
jgi:hypothetical protein